MNETWRKTIQAETSKYKGLETGTCTAYLRKCKESSEGSDREGGRETQEGGDMGIYVYV